MLVPLAYINFDEYIKELNEERDILNKDLNKALKDIENVLKIKAHNKRDNLQQQLMQMSKRLKKVNVFKKNMVMNYPISAGFFFINPFEVVYYAGGIIKCIPSFCRKLCSAMGND